MGVDSTNPATQDLGSATAYDRPRRRPGRPPRISRQMVVDAAIALAPEGLTLQAVADSLGVDRKAVSYYVAGREELIELVTAQTLAVELEHLSLPEGAWQEAVRVYARGVHRVLLREASLSLLIARLPGAGVLVPADELLGRLFGAGFDENGAGHALGLITRVVFTSAKDILFTARFAQHPTTIEVQRILAELPAGQFPHLRRISGRKRILEDEQQVSFEEEIEFLVAGLERLHARRLAEANEPAGHRTS